MCLHRMKIIHRDIKSANCLVNKHWTVKICDFGLSRIFIDVPVKDSSSAGTPEWMAPELIRNEPFSEKCDIFSLGVIMWELCTLNKPWEGTPPERVIKPAYLISFYYLKFNVKSPFLLLFRSSLFSVLFRLCTLLQTRARVWRYLKGHWVVWLQVCIVVKTSHHVKLHTVTFRVNCILNHLPGPKSVRKFILNLSICCNCDQTPKIHRTIENLMCGAILQS